MVKRSNRKVGVKDIALAAGVSIGTVDRVLHNRGEVKKGTREKVLNIINKLGYKPNVLARSLASKKTTRIAIVIPDSNENNPYWEKPVIGIQKASEALANYNLEIIYEYFDASSMESFKEVLEKVCNQNLDGVVLNPSFRSISLYYISIFNQRNIPYVFIDVNIKGVGKLGYFGQDAEQSGRVAAKLMSSSIGAKSTVLVVKQSNKKVFSQHIESRVLGFQHYLAKQAKQKHLKTIIVEIDLLESYEPNSSLIKIFSENLDIGGVFIPNSRGFKVANFIEENKINELVTIGYDLVNENIQHLKNGNISYLIGQKPEDQAFKAIMALFDYLVLKKEVQKINFSPIDIIVKENIDYYNKG